MDKNIGGYLFSCFSLFGVGLTQENGLEIVGAWLAIISAIISLCFTIYKFIERLIYKYKSANKDNIITKEEKEEIKEIIINGNNEIKDNINNVIDSVENLKDINDE